MIEFKTKVKNFKRNDKKQTVRSCFEGDSAMTDNPREVVTESKYNSTSIIDLMDALRSML